MTAPLPRSSAAGRVHARAGPVVASQVLAIDSILRRLAAVRGRLLPASVRAAGDLVAARAWFAFGYARASDFAHERWGRSGRWLHDRAALGVAFGCFPSLERAVTGADGGQPLGSVAALLVGRVATAADIDDWIARSRQLTVRALHREIRQATAPATPPILDDAEDAVTVSLPVPPAIRVAFEETLDLHRAVVGGRASVAEFVEALVAETSPGSQVEEPVHSTPEIASWQTLRRVEPLDDGNAPPAFASPAVRAALDCLARVERSIVIAHAVVDPDEVYRLATLERTIHDLLRLEDEIETRIGQLLAELDENRAWRDFCCEGAEAYGEERLGMSRTTAWRRTAIVRRLRDLREVRAAYLEGRIGIEAADAIQRALGRHADTATQQAWIDRARVAKLKRLCDDENIASRERLLEGRVPTPPSDEAWLRALHRAPGRGLGAVIGLGCRVLAAIESGISHPDVFLRFRLAPDLARDLSGVIEARRRGLAEQAEEIDAMPVEIAARIPPSLRIASALRRRHRGVPAWVGLLGLLEDYVCTWDASPRRAGDAVYERAGYRCAAPGCTSRRNLEIHHVVYRSHGGASSPDNLVCLCRMHHQQGEHGGRMRCRGKAPLDVVWRLGVPRLATWFRNEMRLDLFQLNSVRPNASR